MTLTHHQPGIVFVKPKISLFAFHLCRELTQKNPDDAEKIWSNLAELGKRLNIEELEKLPDKIKENASQLNDKAILAKYAERQDLLPEVIRLNYSSQDGLPGFKGGIYPAILHDTYFVDLSIYYEEDRFSLSNLATINPDDCLSPSHIKASLGQTILFFSQITEPSHNTVENARKILLELFANSGSSNKNSFLLRGEGEFLGGKIYEFEENYSDPSVNNHVLVWLANNAKTLEEEAKGDYYYPLVNLLCSQKKIQFAYYQAREKYQKGESYYRQIEPIVKQFSCWEADKEKKLQHEINSLIATKPKSRRNKRLQKAIENKTLDDNSSIVLSDRVTNYLKKYSDRPLEAKLQQLQEGRLKNLERWSVQIPEVFFNYNICLRDIKAQLTTVKINSQNFQTKLVALQRLNPDEDDLGIWERFATVNCNHFQQQIIYDIEYLEGGEELFQPTIESIRGLLEISAQKQRLAAENAEKERNRSIEVWITVVGSGLAVSGVTSTVMPQSAEVLFDYYQVANYQRYWYGNPISLLLLNLLFHSAIGILSAMLVAIVARGAISKFISFVNNLAKRNS